MAEEVQKNQKEAPAFPADIEYYTAFLSEQGLAWAKVLLEGQSQILAHLRGTEPAEEKQKLAALFPEKQAEVALMREPEKK